MKKVFLLLMFLLTSQYVYAKPPIFVSSIDRANKISEELKIPILNIVSASWCSPCKQLKKEISSNIDKLQDIIILDIDYDNPSNRKYIEKYGVDRIPTIIFDNKKYIGLKNIDGILEIINED